MKRILGLIFFVATLQPVSFINAQPPALQSSAVGRKQCCHGCRSYACNRKNCGDKCSEGPDCRGCWKSCEEKLAVKLSSPLLVRTAATATALQGDRGVLCVAIATAQGENQITVSGTVADTSGAVVAGARISVKLKKCKCEDCPNPSDCKCCPNQVKVETGGDGTFSFSVPHGTYEVSVVAGERNAQVTLDLNEGAHTSVNVTVR